MRQKSMSKKDPVEKVIRDIRRRTRRHYSLEEKKCMVLEGLHGGESIPALCRRETDAAGDTHHHRHCIIPQRHCLPSSLLRHISAGRPSSLPSNHGLASSFAGRNPPTLTLVILNKD